MADPTKTVTTTVNEQGERIEEIHHEDLCSVEVGATAKGDAQIKSVKVYAQDVQEAAEKALKTFNWLRGQIEG